MNILIADDHPLYRQALATILDELGPDIHILHAETFDQVVDRVGDVQTPIDLILLDIYMGTGDWCAVIEQARQHRPETPLIVISGSDSRKDAERAMRVGSYGYIPKSMKKEEILSAIRLILVSGVYVQPRALGGSARSSEMTESPDSNVTERISSLTARQRDVLAEIGAGKSNKLIARALGMTEGTVKLHVAAILKGLGMTNRTQAAIAAHRLNATENMHTEHQA
jgi:DNA-binding NarL/FixJ family response regulator